MKDVVKVIVAGHVNSGKSTIAEALAIALRSVGIDVEIIGQEADELPNPETFERRLQALSAKDFRVYIETKQLRHTALPEEYCGE